MSRIGRALDMWEAKRGPAQGTPSVAHEMDAEHVRLNEFGPESNLDRGNEPHPKGAQPPPAPRSEPTFFREPSATEPPATQQVHGSTASTQPATPSQVPTAEGPLSDVSLRVSTDDQARLVTMGSHSVPIEQYRRLAAVLHDIQLQQGLKTLMITSALPSEGKTLTVINLALTLSHSYAKRVLLVDADLRWPSIHKVLGLPNGVGLSDVLKGQQTDLPIRHVTPRLSVLTAGRPGPAPLAGLTSPRMAALIDECASHFDWVLIDTPPVGLLPDAQPLARLTRAVVFVIAAGQTPAKLVERAVAELGHDCIIGTVLNRVDDRRIPQAGYYDYYDRDHPSAAQ